MANEISQDEHKVMRRPRSSQGPRSIIIRTRVTLDEVNWLGQCATYLGLSLSAYIRLVVLSRKLPPPPLTREAINHLRVIGNELDQAIGLLRWSSDQGKIEDEDPEYFEERCGRLFGLLKKLLVKLEEGE